MTDLVFAVVESRRNRLTQEILSELPNARVESFTQLDELLPFLEEHTIDGMVIDSDAVGGGDAAISWIERNPLACGVLLMLHDLDVPGLRNLYLNGCIEVIGYQHAKADKLVRSLRHSIEKRRLSLKAELAEQENEKLCKTIASISEHTSGALMILDQSGSITFVNENTLGMFGAKEEHELLGVYFEDAIANLQTGKPDEEDAAANVQMWAWEGTWLGDPSTFLHLKPKEASVKSERSRPQ